MDFRETGKRSIGNMTITFEQLDRALASLPPSPRDEGRVIDLCVRPGVDLREPRQSIQLCPERGAIGDRWEWRTWMYTPEGKPDPRVQLAVCNTSFLAMIQEMTGVKHHPGDTIFTDLDLTEANLPIGTRLRAGTAIIEVSDVENDACAKFAKHYGDDLFQWIRKPENRPRRLRGLFAKIVQGGEVRVGNAFEPIRECT